MKRIALAVMAGIAVAAGGASAAEFTLKSDLAAGFDWTDGASYVGDVAPGTGDTIVVPKGMTATLSWTSSDHASFDFVSARTRVTPLGTFDVNVESGGTPTFGAAVSLNGKTTAEIGAGLFRKTGAGELNLVYSEGIQITADNSFYTYHANILVSAGRLNLPQNYPLDTYNWPLYVRNVTIAAGATLKCPWVGTEKKFQRFQIAAGLDGAGTLEAATTANAAESLVIYNDTSKIHHTFSGAITGGMSFQIYEGSIDFTGTSSSIASTAGNGNFSVHSGTDHTNVVGFASLAGSFGCGGVYLGLGEDCYSHIRYLGTGETTSSGFFSRQTKDGWNIFDGGEHGGLVMTGNVSSMATTNRHTRLVLTGDNATPCEIRGWVMNNNNNWESGGSYYTEKRGTGTWCFGLKPNYAYGCLSYNRGLFAICDGTLQFESVGEKGDIFNNLGVGTETYEYNNGPLDEAYRRDYSVRIGSLDAAEAAVCDPKFQYVGAARATITNRPFGISHKGTILSGTAAIDWTGVSPVGADDATLVLDGTDTTGGNILRGVTDNAQGGKLSLVKKGAGTWQLSDEASLSGQVRVDAGTLQFYSDTDCGPIRYFRFTVRETARNAARFDEKPDKGSSAVNVWAMQRFGLFDDEGNWLCADFEYTDDSAALQPGQVAFVNKSALKYASGAANIATYFKTATGNVQITMAEAITYADTNAHAQIVLRLREDDVGKASRFNILNVEQTTTSYNWKTEITAYTLEGSTDGVHWQILDDRKLSTDEVDNAKNYWWLQDHCAYNSAVGGGSFVASERKGKGYEIATNVTAAAQHVTMLDNATISVASGAKLEATGGDLTLTRFAVDLTGGVGTFSGVTLAATGTLSVTNAPSHGIVSVPLSSDCGFDRAPLAAWSVVINGKSRPSYRAKIVDNAVLLQPAGFVMVIK